MTDDENTTNGADGLNASEAEAETDEGGLDASEVESVYEAGSPDEKPVSERAGEVAAGAFLVPLSGFKTFFVTFLAGILRRMPFVGKSFWRGQIKWSTRQYQKAAGADAVNLSAEPHGIEPRAVNWQEADPEDPEVEPGWSEIGGEKTWGPGVEGRDVVRFGKADVILTDRAAHETATPLQLRYAEALDLEQVEPLIEGATVEMPIIEQYTGAPPSASDANGSGGEAVTDGGQQLHSRQTGNLTVRADDDKVGLADSIVDLASDFGDGKGMRVSAYKYRNQKLSKTDAEEMQKQETRGYLAGKSGMDSDAGKWILIAIGAILATVFAFTMGPELIGALFGGGGGEGGLLPITMGM